MVQMVQMVLEAVVVLLIMATELVTVEAELAVY
jgi:hypothetical protein